MLVPPYIFVSRTLQFCFWRRAGTFHISAPCKTHSSDFQFLPHMRSKCCNVASLFVGNSSEDESVFGLGFWHVQKGICSSLCLYIHKLRKQICCFFVWWVVALKLRVCLDWGFGKYKKELIQACICTSISQKIFPGFFKKIAILLHVVTSYLIPPRLLDQCYCPMYSGIRTEMAVFFEGLSKQNDITTLNWGKGACMFLRNDFDRIIFFLKNPVW